MIHDATDVLTDVESAVIALVSRHFPTSIGRPLRRAKAALRVRNVASGSRRCAAVAWVRAYFFSLTASLDGE